MPIELGSDCARQTPQNGLNSAIGSACSDQAARWVSKQIKLVSSCLSWWNFNRDRFKYHRFITLSRIRLIPMLTRSCCGGEMNSDATDTIPSNSLPITLLADNHQNAAPSCVDYWPTTNIRRSKRRRLSNTRCEGFHRRGSQTNLHSSN